MTVCPIIIYIQIDDSLISKNVINVMFLQQNIINIGVGKDKPTTDIPTHKVVINDIQATVWFRIVTYYWTSL